jgi:hypothetical protein
MFRAKEKSRREISPNDLRPPYQHGTVYSNLFPGRTRNTCRDSRPGCPAAQKYRAAECGWTKLGCYTERLRFERSVQNIGEMFLQEHNVMTTRERR